MKVLFLYAFILVSFGAYAQKPDPTSVLWGTRTLAWNDFKGKPGPYLLSDAATMSFIHIAMKSAMDNKVEVTIEALFDPFKSWVRQKSDTLLLHEIGHFNIAELYARKLRKLLTASVLQEKTYEDQVLKLFFQINKEMEGYQLQYDRETNFSRNRHNQKKFRDVIENQLDELALFGKTQMALPLSIQ